MIEAVCRTEPTMRHGFQVQYDRLYQNYGQATAERYRALMHGGQPDRSTRQRWISNRIHRPKAFNEMQSQIIRSEYSAGYTCRQLAQKYGVSQGTISSVVRNRGAYRR